MSVWSRARLALFGPPKDVKDPHAFHKVSLVALLAWVGLGADGLSSSAYGPDEAYRALGENTGLAVFLAVAAAATVFIISYGYSRIIEQFPAGGGGFVVASKLLGPKVGVVSGSALVVDYVLTIAISIASGADAIFSFLPHAWQPYKLAFAFAGLGTLTVLNLRGVKESVTTIAPIFGVFLLTHVVLLGVTIFGHIDEVGAVSARVRENVDAGATSLGVGGLLIVALRAYSLGGGTYTGIEAVSNGMAVMREPRVQTAKRTMLLMATSLAITAGGILLCYVLVRATPEPGKTLNAVLAQRVAGEWQIAGVPIGHAFVIVTLLSEGGLLFVAAQAGFMDGPRVMANMATDSWLPHRYAALSERLTMRNGVQLMAGAAALALIYTGGDVSKLVVMYSINVFLTFSLSNIAMTVFWIRKRKEDPTWIRHLPAHVLASLLCVGILLVTVVEKFGHGGWLTVIITTTVVAFCFLVKRHYARVGTAIRSMEVHLPDPHTAPGANERYSLPPSEPADGEPDPALPVAAIFVGGYGALGRHALTNLIRTFPGHFKGVVFVSIAIVDSDTFKGAKEVEALERKTQESLDAYVRFGRWLGLPSTSAMAVGTEIAVEAEELARGLVALYPKALFVAGQIVFAEDTAWNRLLHNETAFIIQRKLQHEGIPMIVHPVMLDLDRGAAVGAIARTTSVGQELPRVTSAGPVGP
ncbi:MAG: amino acid permease [Deltaproteobacteria bacterium]|nr:amino acid permease [Deltaproteobacteria bacterium]